ncbi:MAG: hypothetical protein GY856_32335 [bacterium]|nr:hypothetical protein [bacterium]
MTNSYGWASRAAHRLAAALGQSERILERIEKGELHPAMAAYGLWRDEPDLADLVDEIYEDRRSSIDANEP